MFIFLFLSGPAAAFPEDSKLQDRKAHLYSCRGIDPTM